MSTGNLKGLRVLDLSRMLSGPCCIMHLEDHGAELFKTEGPSGDASLGNDQYRADDPDQPWAGYFVNLNRGRRSVQLDLKTPQGCADFRALAATGDVIVESFRPCVMGRLGLSRLPRYAPDARAGVGWPRITGPRCGAAP